ncbi:MAG: hypothetical protein LUE16_08560 [Lachnospiraceae bacterium]|nr:hypothetical protein [Lachnospiraceae bacterium]
MTDRFFGTELLVGKEGMERLKNAAVAVSGIGGAGRCAAERREIERGESSKWKRIKC